MGGRHGDDYGSRASAHPRPEFVLLYKVTVGRDTYLGTPEQVVLWMSKAHGAPEGGVLAYMRGIADRVGKAGKKNVPVDVSEPLAFLESLESAGFVTMEERSEASTERVDPKGLLDEGPVAFSDKITTQELEDDVFDGLDDPADG